MTDPVLPMRLKGKHAKGLPGTSLFAEKKAEKGKNKFHISLPTFFFWTLSSKDDRVGV